MKPLITLEKSVVYDDYECESSPLYPCSTRNSMLDAKNYIMIEVIDLKCVRAHDASPVDF